MSDFRIDLVTDIVLKLVVAGGTTLLLLADALLRRAGRAHVLRRTRDGLLLGFGLAGALAWWHFLGYPVRDTVHPHDGFHYYLGARYLPELGYTRLYACTLAADLEAGVGGDLSARRLRDLEDNRLGFARDFVARAQACRERFSEERWRAFVADVAWFRARQTPQEWQLVTADHGFNGSPVWRLVGSWLAEREGGAERVFLHAMRLDHALLAAMWIAVALLFGWRAACVGAVFWGTNGFSGSDWTGGSLWRHDWLAALLLGLGALRRGWHGTAGALLGYATLSRVFPGFVVAALALRAALQAVQARSLRPAPGHLRFALGCALAFALLVPLTIAQGGAEAWSGFAENSRKLLATPLLNQMGLRPVVAWERGERARVLEDPAAPDPHLRWKRTQQEHFAERRGIYLAIAGAWLALLARALRRGDDWSAAALGAGAVPIFSQLTSYYHAALLPLALLWRRHPLAGVTMCAFALVTQWIASTIPYADTPFVRMSRAELAAVFLVTWLAGNAEKRHAE